MITYDFQNTKEPLYLFLYKCIKEDIISGKFKAGEKLPSKRAFAQANGVSTITIQNAYDQLISEGYIFTRPKRGYYVANIEQKFTTSWKSNVSYDIRIKKDSEKYILNLSNNGTNPDNFPFSEWTKVSRDVMANQKDALMTISPSGGVYALREAIAEHLCSFRGMLVDPDQIIVGAGTEYLYSLIIQLLQKDKIYAIENPGYKKLPKIYKQNGIDCRFASLDSDGVTISELERTNADVAHICPNHHFPTGITMPAKRRYELLAWANEKEERYIIEDDYDSEFRSRGKPLPTLFSMDGCDKVIYVNTFSKSLTPTIRISYMVLPIHLANQFYETLSFYACTVSNFEQYTLASFIKQGYFKRHINRMRLYYMLLREKVIEEIQNNPISRYCSITENDSGLHFLLQLSTSRSSDEIKKLLEQHHIRINTLEDYYHTKPDCEKHLYIINYSVLTKEKMTTVLEILNKIQYE